MSGVTILGTGRHLPGVPVPNHALARVMETSDEWIQTRTGIKQRYFARDGQGPSDLAVEASKQAIDDAGIEASDVDYIIFATMTPDYFFRGHPIRTAAGQRPGSIRGREDDPAGGRGRSCRLHALVRLGPGPF